jgi:hypothetical protein
VVSAAASRSCRGSGCRSGRGPGGTLGTENSCLQARFRTGSPRSAGSGGASHRHVECLVVVWYSRVEL